MGAFLGRLFAWRRLEDGEGEDESLESASSMDSLIPHGQVTPTLILSPAKKSEVGDLKEPLIEKLPLDLLLRSANNMEDILNSDQNTHPLYKVFFP